MKAYNLMQLANWTIAEEHNFLLIEANFSVSATRPLFMLNPNDCQVSYFLLSQLSLYYRLLCHKFKWKML